MTKPDWGRLGPNTYVKVWEACALSVGLEPSSMKFEDDRWGKRKEETRPYITSKSFPTPEVEKNYKALLRDLVANLFVDNHFRVANINYLQGKGYYGVRLDEFVRWATLNVKWLALPPELAALVLDKSNSNSTPTEFKVQPASVVAIEQSCIDEEAVAKLLANLPKVSPSSASDTSQASASESNVGNDDLLDNTNESNAARAMGLKSRDSSTRQRLANINNTNKLGDKEVRLTFKSMEEVKSRIVTLDEQLKNDTSLPTKEMRHERLANLIGCDPLTNTIYKASTLPKLISVHKKEMSKLL